MSSRGGNNGVGVGVQSIPPASRKMVQSLKEIVNCPEAEIYATLKDCNMDPNEAVNKLLSQDPFHEVKSKRDKKKETKDSTESRSRGGNSTSTRGARSGTDRYVGHGGSNQFRSSESGASYGKPSYKKEIGTNPYTSSSPSASGMAGHNTYQHPLAPCDSVTSESKVLTTSVVDGYSAPQPSSGYQPVWGGIPGQKSLADIVKMGRPQSKPSSTSKLSHNNVSHHLPLAEDHVPKVPEVYTEPANAPDEWPLMEPPQVASFSSVLESNTDSQLNPNQSELPYDRTNEHPHSENSETEAEDESSVGDHSANLVGSATVSSGKLQEDNSGDVTLFDNDMYTNLGSYQAHGHTFQNEEVEETGAPVSSDTPNLQQLSIHEDHKASYREEEGPSVVIPNHLQVQTDDCLHLSFGSFGSGLGTTGFSEPFTSRSNVEEQPPIEDAPPVIGHSDTRNPEYYEDESIRATAGETIGHRTSAGGAGSFDSPSASQSDVSKPENPELAHENQYAFPSSSPGYTFENAQQLNAAFNYSQMSSQMQNLAPFSTAMTYTNSLPSTLLAANVPPAREPELPYSPFPMAQPMPSKYGSSLSSSSISVAEALKNGFQSVQPTPQNSSGTSVATGPALPQHLAVHPYSQPTLPLGPFTNMIGYPFLPQSYTYMPSGYQQAAFAGNSTYPQSLAAILPQYKNNVSASNLPNSAAVPSGYGAFGGSTTIPGNYTMNPPAAAPAVSSVSYDDLLSSQYKDNNHLLSLQQNDNSAMWLHGPGSRTMSAVPPSTYYSFQGQQSQQPGGFRQGQQPSQTYGALGYPNYYHSQTGMSLEHQAQNPRDGAHGGSQGGQPKQSQQLWQNSY